MAKSERRAFIVGVELVPGTTLAQARDLERRLEDYIDAHELQLSGHHLTYVVSAQRGLGAADQVDLIDWLIGQTGVRNVRVSPLGVGEAAAPWSEGFLLVTSCEVPVIALSMLYRCRRIAPELYLQILGGFVRSVAVH